MSQILAPFQLLELNVISAQDLAPLGRNMRTYAVAYVHPDRKLSTRVDTQGHTNPTWNDKFVFRVDEEFLYADTSAIMIEIYALHWFKDIHVGTVRVLVGNLIPPPTRPFHNDRATIGMRFVALQVRRPSGRPQGILNIGVAVLDSSMRSMPLYTLNASAVGYRHLMGEKDAYDSHNHLSPHMFSSAASKPELRRTKSDTSSLVASETALRHQRAIMNKGRHKASSVVSDSIISGSEVGDNKKNSKKKKKKKINKSPSSKTSSVVSDAASALSDSIVPWKVKNGKTSANNSDAHVEPPPQPPPVSEDKPNNNKEEEEEEYVVEVENDEKHKEGSSVNTVSETTTNDTEINEEGHNIVYQVNATPKRHFRTSPEVATPPQFKNSPKPHYKNSPKPEYRNSPLPQYINSPMPEFRNSPKPQFKNSPMPQHFKNSPMHQFKNSPKPQFRNSPALTGQFRNSPVVAKYNPAMGFGGSHRGTPLHQLGKRNSGFEYATPMRSNLANMRPLVMTESELGPSPSEVAAAMARKPVIDEGDNSTVGGLSLNESVEGLQSKLERWRTELPPVIDRGEFSSFPTTTPTTKSSRHSRRHTDGGNGLFSCFSNICGIECSIVCGGDPKAKKKSRHPTSSAGNTSLQ